ncbi:MCE family protein [Actinophytocola sp.]|uniref:MCE family protein n=1 Tax=Actinophytocola sp. TaxID=1872138 RepID=UPI002D7F7425|nr:MCE family protein [Actinophytocola sp.]HET9138482.1 MCE family protein [Actinophytocola sp.]
MKPGFVAVLVCALVAGCGSGGLYDVALPGGPDVGDHPYRVTAEFADVLDLVPQAAVKVHDVAVGRVERIELAGDNVTALVRLVVNGDVALPADAQARLRQSSLLGEKYVELRAPDPSRGHRLADGAVIPIAATNRNPEIEEVLGALSLLLNGGGVGQLQTILHEVNQALAGNEPQLRSLLSTVDKVVSDLDAQQGDIVRAIDALNRLSGSLAGQTANLTTALDRLAPGLRVITEQRDSLVAMLGALDRLSDVAVDTVNRGAASLAEDLRLLEPTLRTLAQAGADLPNSLQILATYPFTDYFLNTLKGDFVNVDVRFDLDLSVLLENLGNASTPLVPVPAAPIPAPPPPVPLALPPIPPQPPAPDPLSALLGALLGGGR